MIDADKRTDGQTNWERQRTVMTKVIEAFHDYVIMSKNRILHQHINRRRKLRAAYISIELHENTSC